MMEQDAAPAGGFVPRTREASGPRSCGITTAPRGASLDWDWQGSPRPRKRGPGDLKSPPVERREAPLRRSQGEADTPRKACRAAAPAAQEVSQTSAFLGAPLPRSGAEMERRRPRAAKNRGDDARALASHRSVTLATTPELPTDKGGALQECGCGHAPHYARINNLPKESADSTNCMQDCMQ